MSKHPIILYDGDCAFCSRIVVFVVERDREARFRFAPLQSQVGGRILDAAGIPRDRMDTIVLFDEGTVRTKSTAALAIASRLGGVWRLTAVFRLVPRPVRDIVYDWVARNRLRFLRGADRCVLPAVLDGRLVEAE